MVKSVVLDHVRFWGLILKRKNQIILLIHVISHEAIISKAWHASYVIITSSIPLHLPQEQFSHGGEAGYSQEYAFSLKKTKTFLIPWGAVGKINNSSLLLHSQSLSIGHYSLLFTILEFDFELRNQKLGTCFFSICCTDCIEESGRYMWPPHSCCQWKLKNLGREPIVWFLDVLLV